MADYSPTFGRNADLIKAVGDLHIRDGETVADVTYGPGAFQEENEPTCLSDPGIRVSGRGGPQPHGLHRR